ncbi:collagenase [Bowmanella dokdonensis]|uniref:Collagenase n=1 Tax=Bowmanella dokdonensis TaxID=751969 RepID=A0A939IQN5_9ALTE|nr:collagenase [Bowmanella dokdonensis]MBN7825239.1 collagenase [Bowmanella dokdonensis]
MKIYPYLAILMLLPGLLVRAGDIGEAVGFPQRVYDADYFEQHLTGLEDALAAENWDWQALEDALQGLRYFSYLGDTKTLQDASLKRLAISLAGLAIHSGFKANDAKAWRAQEQYAVLAYRYFPLKSLSSQWSNALPVIFSLLGQTLAASDDTQKAYAWWENIRHLAFMAYQARNVPALKSALMQRHELPALLLERIQSSNGWQLDHLVWTLAYYHILLDEQTQRALDIALLAALEANPGLSREDKKRLFSQRYLVNSFRGKQSCEDEYAAYCLIPDESEVLPHTHVCREGLHIRYKQISETDLSRLCASLGAQEGGFHALLATAHKPVANDFNDRLEVLIFDDYSDYNLAGALLFDIGTDNGGMYIEGTPSDPDNQARFFTFRMFWQRQPFGVWNLKHEYIHYLDGHFAAYGAFNHFPSHMVWWAEGLAEWLAEGEHNSKLQKLLQDTKPEDVPSLETIFAARYEDGLDLTYRWSYLAWRFLASRQPQTLAQLAVLLRQDFFDGYLRALEQLADEQETAFQHFVGTVRNQDPVPDNKPSGNYLGRYLYRSYLQPPQLGVDEQHFHLLQALPPSESRMAGQL